MTNHEEFYRIIIDKISGKKIFYTVLDWGLGHASRSVPFIEKIIEQGNEVIVGGNGGSLELIKSYFPKLTCYNLPAYGIIYYRNTPAWLSIILQLQKINKAIEKEHEITSIINDTENFDLIISDSRYGTYLDDVYSVIISHQSTIYAPFFENFINKKHQKLLTQFKEIWIPDLPKLMHDVETEEIVQFSCSARYYTEKTKIPSRLYNHDYTYMKFQFIGWLSRWKNIPVLDNKILVILSGPEPLRTVLEEKLIKIINKIKDFEFLVVRGTDQEINLKFTGSNVNVHNVMNKNNIEQIVSQAKYVISRSGYSTMMDIISSKRLGIIIPTPGQWEQEKLALWADKDIFIVIEEKKLSEKRLLNAIKSLQEKVPLSI